MSRVKLDKKERKRGRKLAEADGRGSEAEWCAKADHKKAEPS